jgi:epoxyqueuosine reductase
LGSWVFLGVLITSMEFEPDEPIADFCGSCTLCLDACPTNAIPEPYLVDATRCISYVTIEQKPKEEIASPIAENLSGWAFGCDICQDVCPWNRFQQPSSESAFAARPEIIGLTIEDVLEISDEEFDSTFAGSPVRRATAEGMRRNARALDRR